MQSEGDLVAKYDPYDTEGHTMFTSIPTEEVNSKTLPTRFPPPPPCINMDTLREMELMKHTCPYGTTTRPTAYLHRQHPHTYESPKFV